MMINVLPVDYGFHNCFWFSLFRPCWHIRAPQSGARVTYLPVDHRNL